MLEINEQDCFRQYWPFRWFQHPCDEVLWSLRYLKGCVADFQPGLCHCGLGCMCRWTMSGFPPCQQHQESTGWHEMCHLQTGRELQLFMAREWKGTFTPLMCTHSPHWGDTDLVGNWKSIPLIHWINTDILVQLLCPLTSWYVTILRYKVTLSVIDESIHSSNSYLGIKVTVGGSVVTFEIITA